MNREWRVGVQGPAQTLVGYGLRYWLVSPARMGWSTRI